MDIPVIEPPFGTYALPAWAERLRRVGQRTGRTPLSRRASSVIRRICMAGRPDPFDVEPFPGQRARLYPRDNLSEKRVFGGAQFWDHAERRALDRAIRRANPPFCFVDAGANVGLYTLAVRSLGPVRAVAIEPDGENRRRLEDNLAASGADDVTVAPVALSDREGNLMLLPSGANRGEIAIGNAEDGATDGAMEGTTTPARPLLDVVVEAGLPRIDALKIDIEGAEEAVLSAFFETAPRALWPDMVLIEARRGEDTEALSILRQHAYDMVERTRMNAILTLSAARMPRTTAGGPYGEA